jgi:hypothetical protein
MANFRPTNKDYYRELAAFLMAATSTNPIKIGITNNGNTLLTGVRVVWEFDTSQMFVIKELPPYPKPTFVLGEYVSRMSLSQQLMLDRIRVDYHASRSKLTIEFGKVQIGASQLSPEFNLGTENLNPIDLVGHVYCDQFGPQSFQLRLEPIVTEVSHTAHSFVESMRQHETGG